MSSDSGRANAGGAGKEIGAMFWVLWMIVLTAFNAWMAFVIHPNTDAYNGYDVLYWIVYDFALVVLLLVNAAILVAIRKWRRRRRLARAEEG